MPRYIAFLRGINLGGRRPPMSQLRELFSELGFTDVATFIASGNVLFTTSARQAAALESRIARHLESALGYPVDTFVRTAEEVRAVIATARFPDQAEPANTTHVAFLHEPLPAATARALTAIRTDTDAFAVSGREYYWLCRIRTSESEVWKLPAIRALKLPDGTMRNLTSIGKLAAQHLT